MRNFIMPTIAVAWAFVVSASPALGQAQSGPARPTAFLQCTACHSTEPGKTIFGPSLAGVAGRKAASLPGYAYSDALRKSGLVWNAATLDKWLTSPQKTVPGTRMPFPGIADAGRRREVIAYLMTLH